jgi:DNA polymerase III epsilon subunit-like protein
MWAFSMRNLRARRADPHDRFAVARVLDTLALARQRHPGQRNSLDALCKRYSVDNSNRDLHGALLDARLLADVYLAMTGGQAALALDDRGFAQAEMRAARRARHCARPGRSSSSWRRPPSSLHMTPCSRLLRRRAVGARGCPRMPQAPLRSLKPA